MTVVDSPTIHLKSLISGSSLSHGLLSFIPVFFSSFGICIVLFIFLSVEFPIILSHFSPHVNGVLPIGYWSNTVHVPSVQAGWFRFLFSLSFVSHSISDSTAFPQFSSFIFSQVVIGALKNCSRRPSGISMAHAHPSSPPEPISFVRWFIFFYRLRFSILNLVPFLLILFIIPLVLVCRRICTLFNLCTFSERR